MAPTAFAVNSVVVESKSVPGGATNVRIGIFLTNDMPTRHIVIPLTVRSISGGAYITRLAIKRTVGSRIGTLLSGINMHSGFTTEDLFRGCQRPVDGYLIYFAGFKGPPIWSDTSSHAIAGPPFCAMINCGVFYPTELRLPYGTDGSVPSFHLLVDVGNTVGQFEVDTACVGPSTQLVFAVDSARISLSDTVVSRVPSFTKGVVTVTPTAVFEPGGGSLPSEFRLNQNYPNPFNASTTIEFATSHDDQVSLEVYDLLGRRVKTLVEGHLPPTQYRAEWDGTDPDGKPLPSGIYVYRLTTGNVSESKKMILLK